MLFCGFAQILIALVIIMEIDKPLILNVEAHVTIVRFVCLSVIHFQLANEYNIALKSLKYLAFHMENFKYSSRAFMACNIAILSVLITEYLSIYYIMV